MKKLISLLLSAVMTAGIFTAVPTGAVAAEKQVSLKKSSATLKITRKNGKTVYGTVNIKLVKAKGVKITKKSFKSSNKKTATVSKSGKVTAKKAGKAKITVKVKYTVTQKNSGKKAKKISRSKTLTFKVTVQDKRVKTPAKKSYEPTAQPTEPVTESATEATETATQAPTEETTADPTEAPTEETTVEPTEAPTEETTTEPTEAPTEETTTEPTEAPTEETTAEPTVPTEETTTVPDEEPTGEVPTEPNPFERPKYGDVKFVDKSTATFIGEKTFENVKITDIFSDCFFVKPDSDDEIKVNGELSNYWCRADYVNVSCRNVYYDSERCRYEGELEDVTYSDIYGPPVDYKPVIYLYPEEELRASVKLLLNGALTCVYPEYNDGWNVTARPDGTLIDAKGMEYNYLFWEGRLNTVYDVSKGFCVKGRDTASFLEQALKDAGLNRREANEFITFWLPKMQDNPYNIISFQQEAYTDAAQLNIDPNPDTVIRVFMTWYPVDEYTELPAQELTAPERNGFTVVEWGGAQIR